MNLKFVSFAAVVAAFAFSTQVAGAGERHHTDPRFGIVSTGVGAATTAAYFSLNDWNWKWDSSRHGITAAGAVVLTTVGCMALSPIVATAVVNRPLTYREAHALAADCVIPFIGSWLVNQAYDHHILWAPDEPVAVNVKKKHWKKHAQK